MQPSERLPYSAIETRPPLKLPDGLRLIIWPVFSLEHWDISRPMARTVISPPQGQPMLPDHPNWSWHEYGMRVAFWRIKRMFEALKIIPTVAINGRTCETYPQVIRAVADAGWEINAHGYDQIPMHKVEDERASIIKTIDVITKFWGRPPRGWFGPGLTQTYNTVDYLSEAGIEYIGDWALDDEPVTLKTKHKPMVALPYNFEQHDIVMMMLQGHTSDQMYRRSIDAFEWLYKESAERAKIMSISVHPYISGVAHRIAYVERAFKEIQARPGVAFWNGSKILDWYLGAQKSKA
jgi:peptidoglycan/xylan/chitin deacetylase (PgdA/CDA1 family)